MPPDNLYFSALTGNYHDLNTTLTHPRMPAPTTRTDLLSRFLFTYKFASYHYFWENNSIPPSSINRAVIILIDKLGFCNSLKFLWQHKYVSMYVGLCTISIIYFKPFFCLAASLHVIIPCVRNLVTLFFCHMCISTKVNSKALGSLGVPWLQIRE